MGSSGSSRYKGYDPNSQWAQRVKEHLTSYKDLFTYPFYRTPRIPRLGHISISCKDKL